MSNPVTVSQAQAKALWEQIWYSQNGYYAGLPADVKAKIDTLHLSLLDEARARAFGAAMAPRNDAEIDKPKDPAEGTPAVDLEIHDPKLYSFDGRHQWIPWAQSMASGTKRGSRAKGYPEGALIHWTAGHRNGLKAGGDFQRSSGMQYLLMDQDGNLGQGDPLNVHGYHAGASSFPGLAGTVSDELVGIETQAAGNLRKHGDHFYPWWDEGKNLEKNRIPASDVVYSPKRGNIAAGYYHLFTPAQMMGLRRTCCWLHLNWPSVFKIALILGHDEVSPGRKSDPGAAMVRFIDGKPAVMTMADFRDQIADDVREILSNR
jgi:hypothetical protein